MVTTTTPIVLNSLSGSLTLTFDERGVDEWCQVHLLLSGVCRPLGAERLKYIAAHLASFLADTSPGQRWVFSLSELHTSAYGEHIAGEAILHLQNADAKMFAKLVLTAVEKSQWKLELSQHTGLS
jgi:hypothetical protein